MAYALGPVKPWVAFAANEIGNQFHVATIFGVGARPNASDHPLGLALDFMVGGMRSKGDSIADYAISNADRLGITYILWQQRIWHADGRGWEPMEDRGSVTANHRDHVHISFTADGKPRGNNNTVGTQPVGNSDNPLIPNEIEVVAELIKWLMNPQNLLRLGLFALGAGLFIGSLLAWAGSELKPKAAPIAKAITKVVK